MFPQGYTECYPGQDPLLSLPIPAVSFLSPQFLSTFMPFRLWRSFRHLPYVLSSEGLDKKFHLKAELSTALDSPQGFGITTAHCRMEFLRMTKILSYLNTYMAKPQWALFFIDLLLKSMYALVCLCVHVCVYVEVCAYEDRCLSPDASEVFSQQAEAGKQP